MDNRPGEHRLHNAWWAAILLIVIVGFVSGTAAIFGGVFQSYIPVKLTAERAGLVMETNARVKLRGVEVGRVKAVTAHHGTAELQLEIYPDQIQFIPSNVQARIQATTVFGAKFVELVYPPDPSPHHLAAGAVLHSQNVSTEVNTIFQNVSDLLKMIDPAKLNAILTAVADGVRGQGPRMGEATTDLKEVLAVLNSRSDTIGQDWRSLKDFNNTYAAAASDIVSVLNNAATTATTIVDHSAQLDQLLTNVIGLSTSGTDLLAASSKNLVGLVDTLEPTTQLLREYSPTYACTLEGATFYLNHGGFDAWGGHDGRSIQFDVGLLLGNDPYQYPDNLPIVAAKGGPGGKPGCGSLPDVSKNFPVRQMVTNTGCWTSGLIRGWGTPVGPTISRSLAPSRNRRASDSVCLDRRRDPSRIRARRPMVLRSMAPAASRCGPESRRPSRVLCRRASPHQHRLRRRHCQRRHLCRLPRRHHRRRVPGCQRRDRRAARKGAIVKNNFKAAAWRLGVLLTLCSAVAFCLFSVFAEFRFGGGKDYFAEFTNVSGLKNGDVVRIAGVEVGKVEEIAFNSDATVRVKFAANDSVALTTGSRAAIRYDNVFGGRYLALQEGAGGVQILAPGQTIPTTQTVPALDLDSVIGGFKPLFRALDPQKVNELSAQLINALQGQGATIGSFLDQAAAVTSTLADRDNLIGEVIVNLNTVLGSLGDQSDRLDKAVVSLSELVKGLAARKTDISNAVAYTDAAADSIADLLAKARQPFQKVVHETDRVAAIAVADHEYLDNIINTLPDKYRALGRQAIYGDFFSFYLCDVVFRINGKGGQPVYVKVAGQSTGRCAPK